MLMNNPYSPKEVKLAAVKSTGREFLPGSTENSWNRVNNLEGRLADSVFTPKVIELEKQAIAVIKQRIV